MKRINTVVSNRNIILLCSVILIITLLFFYRPRNYFKNKTRVFNKEFEKLRRIESKNAKTNFDYFYLGKKYHQGIPEVIHNEKVLKGLKPNFYKAVEYYSNLIGTEYHYYVVIPLADIYNYEYTDDFSLIDKARAREYYNQGTKAPDVAVRTEAREKLFQLNLTMGLPSKSGIDADQLFRNRAQVIVETPPEPLPNIPPQIQFDGIKNDTQNVHDSGVVNSVKNIIDKMRNSVKLVKNEKSCFTDIKNYIKEHEGVSEIIKKKANDTVDMIQKTNSNISSCGITEGQLVHLVWNKILGMNKKDSSNTKENLIVQLSEANEYGSVVCAQGRFNHVLSCLDVADDKNKILPLWAIKEEMLGKAGKIRDKVIQSFSKEDQKLIEEDDKQKTEIYEDSFRHALKQQFAQDYANVVSTSFINSQVDSWFY